ncbi:MAG: BRO1 domain-containing protein, partial [Olpidium bornovanus]
MVRRGLWLPAFGPALAVAPAGRGVWRLARVPLCADARTGAPDPQSPFIQVPLKRTDDLDWASPLKRYIADVYQEDPDDYAPECATFHQLRNDMRGAGPDSTGLDILYKYYRQLELLDLRFPVDEKDGHVKVHFNWYDAFTGRATAQHSLAYEKACVIFNIAATLTAMASGQTRSEVDGLKRAYRYLQCAAGVFNFINDNFLHAPSADLSRESVKVLSQLTLAQAQECMLEKSLGEKKKPGLIAKIAAHAAEEYAKIADQFGELEKKGWIDKAWLKLVQVGVPYVLRQAVKASYFNALAQYNKGLAVEAEVNHGEALARYTVAEQAAKEASRTVREFSTVSTNTPLIPHDAAASLAEITKSNQSVVSEKKAKQTHDNDMIYHAVVPNTNTLQSMEKQPLTAP